MLKRRTKKFLAGLIAFTMAAGLSACAGTTTLPAGMEDMSEEELQEMMDAYNEGKLDTDSKDSDTEAEESEEKVEDKAEAEEKEEEEKSEESPDAEAGASQNPVPEIQTSRIFTSKYSDDHEKLIFEGSCTVPLLTEESEKIYPELGEALKKAADGFTSVYKENTESNIEGAQERYEEAPDFFDYGYFTDNTGILLRRVDETVLSYSVYSESFLGGAHGLYTETGINYDVKTGKRLLLEDVISDISGINDILKDKLLEKYPDVNFMSLEDSFTHYDPTITEQDLVDTEFEEYTLPYNWMFTPVGILFYFGPYELASYAEGSQEVVIGYDEIPDLINPDYIPGEDAAFVYDFRSVLSIFDIDGDGKEDELTAYGEYEDNGEVVRKITVTLNDETEVEATDLLLNPGFIHHYICLEDGRKYIYTEAGHIYEENVTLVFDLNDGKVKYSGIDSVWPKAETEIGEDIIYKKLIPTDPDNMKMCRLFYILSTFYGTASFHPGEDGMPETDEAYSIDVVMENSDLISQKDLICDIVDEDGKVVSEDETIKSGEKFTMLSTDGETYVDAKISDGRIVRLNITSTEYPCYVDEVPADEVFETLYYAG